MRTKTSLSRFVIFLTGLPRGLAWLGGLIAVAIVFLSGLLCGSRLGWLGNASSAPSAGVRWQCDVESACRLAAETNRLVLVHFWSDASVECRRMDQDVFSRWDVGTVVETHFVPVKVNARRFPALAMELGVSRWPSEVIMTQQGEVLERIGGETTAEGYVSRMMQLAATARQPSRTPATQTAASLPPTTTEAEPAAPAVPTATAIVAPGSVVPVAAVFPTAPAGPTTATEQAVAMPPSASVAAGPSPSGNVAAPTPAASVGPALMPVPPSEVLPPRQESAGGAVASAIFAPTDYAGTASAPSPADNGPAFPAGSPAEVRSTAARGSAPLTAAPPADNALPLALDGYCPVSLAQKRRWVRGDRQWGVIHRGQLYLCGGPEELKQFLATPDAYAPVASGIDLVAAVERDQVVPGRREHGTWYGGRLYLFESETAHQLFERFPERYVSAAPPMATSPVAGNGVRRF